MVASTDRPRQSTASLPAGTGGEGEPFPEGAALERMPPQDLEAEQSVLGAMMLSKDAIPEVSEVAAAEDFYRPAHEAVFRTILDLYGRDEPADPITVVAELTRAGALSRAGGAGYVQHLVQVVPTAANGAYYAQIVRERALMRRLVQAGARITRMGYDGEGEAEQLVHSAAAEIHAITQTRQRDEATPIGNVLEGALDEIEANGTRTGITGVPTGYTDMDNLTQGLHPGQMVVIAGRPALGKSTVAVDIARHASVTHRLPGVYFSLEMSRNEIAMRMLSAEARVALHHMRSGSLTHDDWTSLANVMPRVSAAPFFVDDSPNLTLMEIQAKALRLQQRHDLRYVIVDYLQLVLTGAGRRPESRQQEVGDISRSMKLLAKRLGVPVIVLSQLNRGPEHRPDKKPMLADLRDSGAVEQDADQVWLLHREDAYEKESRRGGEADLIVAKHRNGPTATVTLAFQGHYSRFVDMAST